MVFFRSTGYVLEFDIVFIVALQWKSSEKFDRHFHFSSVRFENDFSRFFKVVNDRWGFGTWCKHGDYYTCNDRFNPGHLLPHKWENCFTVEKDDDVWNSTFHLKIFVQIDKTSWAFRRTSKLNDYMTIEEILQELIVTIRWEKIDVEFHHRFRFRFQYGRQRSREHRSRSWWNNSDYLWRTIKTNGSMVVDQRRSDLSN